MPLKKGSTSSIVGEYDVELMTVEELGMYVGALKEEHERMRNARNLYQKDKNELLNCLKCFQESIIDKKGVALQKDVEIQEVIYDAELKSRFESELNKIIELESSENAIRSIFEAFINIKSAEIRHKEENNALMRDITERDRQIQHLEFTSKLMLIELEENNLKRSHEVSKALKDTFDNSVREYRKQFYEVLEDFSENKINNMIEGLGNTPNIKDNSFAESVEKMTEYFKHIYWKNLKIIEELNNKLMKLKKELNTVTLKLRDVTKENEELICVTSDSVSPTAPETPPSSLTLDKGKILEELTYENYLLTLKLEMLNREYTELKQKFVTALRRVHQIADFKALVLEKKLLSLQNLPKYDT